MTSTSKSVRVLTTSLTAGECIDRLRRISKRDDGDERLRINPTEPESLLLAKTTDGFTLRIRRPGSVPLGLVLDVRFEPSTVAGERLKLVGQVGFHKSQRIVVAIGMAVCIALLGMAWRSAFQEHLAAGIAIGSGVVGLALLPIFVRRAIFVPDSRELLFDVVKSAVDGDQWRVV
jgi:hypothetical protein